MAQYNLGIVLGEQGKTDQAIDHYRDAIALRPDYAEAHYNLGRLLVEQGHADEAIEHYEKTVEINPADSEAENNLGVTLFGIGRVDDAIRIIGRLSIRTELRRSFMQFGERAYCEGRFRWCHCSLFGVPGRVCRTNRKRNTISQAPFCAKAA